MLTAARDDAGLQHLPGQGLCAHRAVHGPVRGGQGVLHPERQRADREAELPHRVWLRAVGSDKEARRTLEVAGVGGCLGSRSGIHLCTLLRMDRGALRM